MSRAMRAAARSAGSDHFDASPWDRFESFLSVVFFGLFSSVATSSLRVVVDTLDYKDTACPERVPSGSIKTL